jgi:hypothetical protein
LFVGAGVFQHNSHKAGDIRLLVSVPDGQGDQLLSSQENVRDVMHIVTMLPMGRAVEIYNSTEHNVCWNNM